MSIEKLRPTFTLTEDRLRELAAVVPEAFADGKINWDTFREALSEHLEDESQEHFGLFWPGKRDARRLAALPSKGTLVPQPGHGVNEDTTHNLFIEGDNLEVLKLMQKSYAGRVKMIYIDPPYNTGNDFVYPDDYSEPLEAYLKRTGQMDELGQLLTTNNRSSGRYHSNWLNMMYPRLLLARQLLRDDGIIFVSIDDHELHHLRQIMNELFGEENYTGLFVWEKKKKPSFLDSNMGEVTEYVVSFAKNRLLAPAFTSGKVEEGKRYPFNNAGNPLKILTFPAHSVKFAIADGVVKPQDMSTSGIPTQLLDKVVIKNGTNESVFRLEGEWRYSQDKVNEFIASGAEINVSKLPFRLNYVNRADTDKKCKNLLSIATYQMSTYEDATAEMRELFGVDLMDYPKPVGLIKFLLGLSIESDDIVLDFFAGSCTTAHALFQQNFENKLHRKFIMVQLPEPTNPDSQARHSGFQNIAEIGRERIRKAIKLIKSESKGKVDPQTATDFGFSCYALYRSSFSEWTPFLDKDTSQLELRFQQAEKPLVEGWKPENLLTEILLLQGFSLDSRISALPEFKKNDVKEISSEFCEHKLYVCLDAKVHPETVSTMHLRHEDILVCLDSALSDEAKIQLADQCNLKVI